MPSVLLIHLWVSHQLMDVCQDCGIQYLNPPRQVTVQDQRGCADRSEQEHTSTRPLGMQRVMRKP